MLAKITTILTILICFGGCNAQTVNRNGQDINTLYAVNNGLEYDKLPLKTNSSEIKARVNLLKELKNKIVSPLTYFIYQLYANSYKCNVEYNEFKTICMEFPTYDKEKNILTLSFLSEFREIEANNNIKKIAENPINELTRELGIGGKTKGLIQNILKDYEIPITIKKNYLYMDDNIICINVSLLIGIDSKLYSYFGMRDCNEEIKVIKKLRAYAL